MMCTGLKTSRQKAINKNKRGEIKLSEHFHVAFRNPRPRPVGAPHYEDEAYAEGEFLENGFTVTEPPVHEVIRVGPMIDTTNSPSVLWETRKHTGDGEVIRANSVATCSAPTEPSYCDPNRSLKRKAEAAADAVRAAVMRGEIDPDLFTR